MDEPGEKQVERFAPTGRATGVVGVLMCLSFAGFGFYPDAGLPPWLIAISVLGAVTCWANLLRPRVSLVGDRLELRNTLTTLAIPLENVDDVVVQQVMVVNAGEERHVSAALGRSRRQISDDTRTMAASTTPAGTSGSYGYLVEHRITTRITQAHADADARGAAARVTERRPNWLELVVLGSAVVVTLVLIVVA